MNDSQLVLELKEMKRTWLAANGGYKSLFLLPSAAGNVMMREEKEPFSA